MLQCLGACSIRLRARNVHKIGARWDIEQRIFKEMVDGGELCHPLKALPTTYRHPLQTEGSTKETLFLDQSKFRTNSANWISAAYTEYAIVRCYWCFFSYCCVLRLYFFYFLICVYFIFTVRPNIDFQLWQDKKSLFYSILCSNCETLMFKLTWLKRKSLKMNTALHK